MDSVDLSVLKTLREWQAGKLPLWLVTVVDTFGSSPRPPGAMLALRGDGLAVGSVSGGCIEDDLGAARKARRIAGRSQRGADLRCHQEEAKRFGLPCGGRRCASICAEPVPTNSDWVEQVLQLVQSHRLVRRTLNLNSLQVELDDAGRNETFCL